VSAIRAVPPIWIGWTMIASASTTASPRSPALGLAQLERLDDLLVARARVAGQYREALESVRGVETPCPDMEGSRRGWFVFVVQVPAAATATR
jgi:dTDP-4-amino-4,6-dideoxygalactose transaminase